MQYNWKIFKWNNGNSRTELTQYLTAPVFLERRCNEQLSSGEVILDNMPEGTYSSSFAPKTKFTLELWTGDTQERYFDFMCDHDDVEHYAGLREVNCHRVSLIEPSVYAQGVHCDNFSLTYEQNDSTLNYKTVVSSDENAVVNNYDLTGVGYNRPNWSYGGEGYRPSTTPAWYTSDVRNNYTLYYANSFLYRWEGVDAIKSFSRNLNGLISNEIVFTMPILQCYANNGSAVADKLFDCPTRCVVSRTTLRNGVAVSGTTVQIISHLYSPANVTNRNDRIMYNKNGLVGLCGTFIGNYKNYIGPGDSAVSVKVFREGEITNLPAIINTNDASNTSRRVMFKTTPLTTQDFANRLSYEYKINLTVEPYQAGAIVTQYTARVNTVFVPAPIIFFTNDSTDYSISYTNFVAPSPAALTASTAFLCRNMLEDAPSNPFLIKGRKYNCYDVFRRAMLTCDTRIFNNNDYGLDEKFNSGNVDIGLQYPIVVHPDWIQRVKDSVMYESVFEGKNLWEVMQQIGYYLHAIPYLEFSRDDKERFALKFKQLGSTRQGNNESNKITIFNSLTLDNFFTQYDSYVTNLFSPQNEVDEWLVCKTSDSSYLVSNETANLQAKYGIIELVAFDIIYQGQTKSALEFVFEKSVYDTLSARTDFVPAKWSALYFQMGTNKIVGLNYIPPTPNNDGYMALKTIVGRLFSNGITNANLKFNDLKFHLKYKTQDNLRITQLRPDLGKFIKNSEFEAYPHNEQFYNPQDKIVDSERFTQNLFGRLIRVANEIYQQQEYARPGQEKEPGDLINLANECYYVTECENEYYPDAIFQKVTYSKNFNQLAQIVTIPSEPRFFEISERTIIRREIRLLDFIKLSTKRCDKSVVPKYINSTKWHRFLRDLIFADNGNPALPNFAYINYKADIHRMHHNLPNNDTSVMFPSSEATVGDGGVVQPKPSSGNMVVIVPLLHFPLRNAIVFEWDMEDNFKAADSVDVSVSGNAGTADSAYFALQPVRYCDVYGRADLFDFKLFYKDNWSESQMRRLPFADKDDFVPTNEQSIILVPESLSIGLDKDNREALSFNYQLNLLHEPHEGDAEDFVVFANLFGKKNEKLRAVLLSEEVSMFNESIKIDASTVVVDNIVYTISNLTNMIKIDFIEPQGIEISAVKAIVLYDTENGTKYPYVAKNTAKLPNEKKLQSWFIYPVFNH